MVAHTEGTSVLFIKFHIYPSEPQLSQIVHHILNMVSVLSINKPSNTVLLDGMYCRVSVLHVLKLLHVSAHRNQEWKPTCNWSSPKKDVNIGTLEVQELICSAGSH